MRIAPKISLITQFSMAALMFLGMSWSQSAGQAERQIARTEEMLERIGSQIPEGNDALWELYFQAVQLQSGAREFYMSGQWAPAENMSKQAYNICLKIEKQISEKAIPANAQSVERILEKVDQIVRKIDPSVLSESDRQLYEKVVELAQIAREKLYDKNIPVARGLAMTSLKAITKIERTIIQEQRLSKVVHAVEKTDRILENISKMPLEQIPGAAQKLVEALEIQISARKALNEGNPESATKLTFSAREKVQDIWKNLASGPGIASFIKAEIEKTESALNSVSPTDVNQQSEHKKAKELINRARNLAGENKFDEAMKSLDEAKVIIAEIISSGETPDKNKATQAIKMTDDFIKSISPNTSGLSAELLKQAQNLQVEAKKDLEKGNIRGAIDKTRMARTIAGQAKSFSQ